MNKTPSFHDLEKLGFRLSAPNGVPARAWINGNLDQLAHDAAMVTMPNAAVPAELTAYWDPMVIDVVTRQHKAREIFSEVQKGDWTTSHVKFRMNELVGSTQPYTDYGQSRTSNANYNWLTRQQYVFQTLIQYGDFEEAVASQAKIQLAADKQRAVAHVIDTDANLFYLKGVAGMDIYGLLNDPSLPAAITPLPSGTGSSLLWADKNTEQIYNDMLALFEDLVARCDGWIDQNSPLTFVISPAAAVSLGRATDFNVSVLDMLKKYFSSMRTVTLPELSDDASGESVMLIADNIAGNKVGELGFSEKIRVGRLVPDLSSFSQKWTSTTYGAVIYYPFAISTMRGIR